MAKEIVPKMKLDEQVERYLAAGIKLEDLISYDIHRKAMDVTAMTPEIYVDSRRFEEGVEHLG